MLKNETIELLDEIEKRIDPEIEEDYINQWRCFWNTDKINDYFTPCRKKTSESKLNLKYININDAVEDMDLMLRKELMAVSTALSTSQRCLGIRANYGTGIMTSILGAKTFIMPYENDTLPTTYSFNDDDKIRNILEKGIPDINRNLGKKVFEMGELIKETFEKYPKISKYVDVFHPDTQGPLDICELLWGGEMFYNMYEEPEFVHDVLDFCTQAYEKVMDKWFLMFPNEKKEFNTHWCGFLYKGNILIRNDSAMNLSPEFYDEFARPYDARLLGKYNGGLIHFCGTGDHYIEKLSNIPHLTGINMSQPHLNDMEKIYQNTIDKGLKIVGFTREFAQEAKSRTNGLNFGIHT